MGKTKNTIEKFWSKVDKTESCWLWLGRKFRLGYGCFYFNGKYRSTHRIAYEAIKGIIPENLSIDHLCRIRHCVNPDHLEAITQRENVLRGVSPQAVNARKTHCIMGHEYTPENIRPTQGTNRICKKCHAIKSNIRYYQKLRNPNAGPRNSLKTHCKRGHEFTKENIINRADNRRECLQCYNLRRLKLI